MKPISFSERPPEARDCAPWPDEPGAAHWVWVGRFIDGGWEWSQDALLCSLPHSLRIAAGGGWTHWLPWYAIPIPGQQETCPEPQIPTADEILKWLENEFEIGPDDMCYPDLLADKFEGYSLDTVPRIIQSAIKKWGVTDETSR